MPRVRVGVAGIDPPGLVVWVEIAVHASTAATPSTRPPMGEFQYVESGANGQPAVAVYVRQPGSTVFRRVSLAVMRIAAGRIAEIIDFSDPAVLDAFGLPETR